MHSRRRAFRTALAACLPAGAAAAPASAQPLTALPAEVSWLVGILLVLLVVTTLSTLLLVARVRRQTRHFNANEARLNTILDSVDTYIYIKDTELRYTYGNRQLCERYGCTPQALLGSRDTDFLPHDIVNRMRIADLRVIQNGERIVAEEELPRPNGRGLLHWRKHRRHAHRQRYEIRSRCLA